MKIDISTQKKYIDQTYQLDRARNELVTQLSDNSLSHDEVDTILKRLQEIYQALSSNAVILADMLAYHIGKQER